MRRRLFPTGPIGWRKSTASARALGDAARRGGGFFTRRRLDEQGRLTGFTLESPDGARHAVFLDFTGEGPRMNPGAFSGLGRELLADASASFLVLDEIGGMELLCPEFMEALEDAFARGIPCIGVMKGPGPAGALVKALGLTQTYLQAANRLRSRLQSDPDTLLYPCGQFDEHALALARQWAQEYAYDGFFRPV